MEIAGESGSLKGIRGIRGSVCSTMVSSSIQNHFPPVWEGLHPPTIFKQQSDMHVHCLIFAGVLPICMMHSNSHDRLLFKRLFATARRKIVPSIPKPVLGNRDMSFTLASIRHLIPPINPSALTIKSEVREQQAVGSVRLPLGTGSGQRNQGGSDDSRSLDRSKRQALD